MKERLSEPAPVALRSAHWQVLEMPLVRPFTTSFGTERRRRVLLLTLTGQDGESGYSECVAGRDPYYSSEDTVTVEHVFRRYLLPALARIAGAASPRRFLAEAERIRGNPMAKAWVEMALWDLGARSQGTPLSRLLGGTRRRIEVGVSVGIQRSPADLVRTVAQYRAQGYRRIKLKVEPGRDRTFVEAVRQAFPEARLWIDANQAYRGEHVDSLARWVRDARVELVEQPFPEDALRLAAGLARRLPRGSLLCLDESVRTTEDLESALRLGAVGAVNVKPGRVGGLLCARAIHDLARDHGIPVWCGGMLETGIGRAHNLALAAGKNFLLPSDLSASDRYYAEDLIDPPFRLGPGSTLEVPRGAGIGVSPEPLRVRKYLRREARWKFPQASPDPVGSARESSRGSS